jgi:uncharacterized membrane protein YkgB
LTPLSGIPYQMKTGDFFSHLARKFDFFCGKDLPDPASKFRKRATRTSHSKRDVTMSTNSIHAAIDPQRLVQRGHAAPGIWTDRVEATGRNAARYGLVLVLAWIGGMKFMAYEAEGISAFVANSPLMNWAYLLFSVRGFSALLGVTEIVVALLIAARPLSARAAIVGSGMAVCMFATTLSFLVTTPGVWEASAGGFPALSVVPGQFLVKDFVLLGVSLRLFAEDWRAIATG